MQYLHPPIKRNEIGRRQQATRSKAHRNVHCHHVRIAPALPAHVLPGFRVQRLVQFHRPSTGTAAVLKSFPRCIHCAHRSMHCTRTYARTVHHNGMRSLQPHANVCDVRNVFPHDSMDNAAYTHRTVVARHPGRRFRPCPLHSHVLHRIIERPSVFRSNSGCDRFAL